MKVLMEITEWSGSVPNHVYFLSDSRDRMFGYVPVATNVPVRFSKPIRFETRGRKFRAVPNSWNFEDLKILNPTDTWNVTGSRGNQYQVEKTENGLTCTCSGFGFRGQCRHVAEIATQLAKNA